MLLLFGASNAYGQKWYTPEVAREIGRVPCIGCGIGGENTKLVKAGNGQITPVTMFYFDTIASYAQGRIVDITTGKPIKGAFIQVQYACWEGCDQKTAATNEAGFFRLGRIGCHGPKGGRANYPLLIQATGYQTLSTEAAEFGGGTYLHIEMAATTAKRGY